MSTVSLILLAVVLIVAAWRVAQLTFKMRELEKSSQGTVTLMPMWSVVVVQCADLHVTLKATPEGICVSVLESGHVVGEQKIADVWLAEK